ncbi:MAG: heavy-metal-associated domain-containing protein [Thiotrichales bacterium]
MAGRHADIVVHIDETLDEHRLRDLEKDLGTATGIISACVHENRRHLLVVDYDPDLISSQRILHSVRHHGVHAELIGM